MTAQALRLGSRPFQQLARVTGEIPRHGSGRHPQDQHVHRRRGHRAAVWRLERIRTWSTRAWGGGPSVLHSYASRLWSRRLTKPASFRPSKWVSCGERYRTLCDSRSTGTAGTILSRASARRKPCRVRTTLPAIFPDGPRPASCARAALGSGGYGAGYHRGGGGSSLASAGMGFAGGALLGGKILKNILQKLFEFICIRCTWLCMGRRFW